MSNNRLWPSQGFDGCKRGGCRRQPRRKADLAKENNICFAVAFAECYL